MTAAVALDAGRLTERVTIQARKAGRDGTGARTAESWVDITTDPTWAEVLPLAGREGWTARQVDAEITHRVVMRYRSGVTSKHRIKWGSVYLNIKGPPRNVGNANVMLEMDCVETED